jgi:hypothetical protein
MRTFHYALEASGSRYTLRSAGWDGQDGTEDDVYPSLKPEKSRNYGFLAPGRSP